MKDVVEVQEVGGPERPKGERLRTAVNRLTGWANGGVLAICVVSVAVILVVALFGQRWDYYLCSAGLLIVAIGSSLAMVVLDDIRDTRARWKRAIAVGLFLSLGSLVVSTGSSLSGEYARNESLIREMVAEWSLNDNRFIEYPSVQRLAETGSRNFAPLPLLNTAEAKRLRAGANFTLGIAEPARLRLLLAEYVYYLDSLSVFASSYNAARNSQTSWSVIDTHFDLVFHSNLTDNPDTLYTHALKRHLELGDYVNRHYAKVLDDVKAIDLHHAYSHPDPKATDPNHGQRLTRPPKASEVCP